MHLSHKRVLVLGVANEESIAWHVAQRLRRQGAAVFIGYLMRFKSRILQLLKATPPELQPTDTFRCDVMVPAQLEETMRAVAARGPLDGIVHSIAFAPPDSFGKPVSELGAEQFAQALNVSAWSLLGVARAAKPHFAPDASVVAMTYLGSTRVVPGYRLMGIAKAALEACVRELAVEMGPDGVRVNAISAGPIRTLSAQAVPDFERMLQHFARVAPMRANVEPADVAELAAFLLSDAARRITGQVIFVDSGFSILGVTEPLAPS